MTVCSINVSQILHRMYLYNKLLIVYLEFKFKEVSYILSSIPIPEKQLGRKRFHFIPTLSKQTTSSQASLFLKLPVAFSSDWVLENHHPRTKSSPLRFYVACKVRKAFYIF